MGCEEPPKSQELDVLKELVDANQMRPYISSSYPADVPKAAWLATTRTSEPGMVSVSFEGSRLNRKTISNLGFVVIMSALALTVVITGVLEYRRRKPSRQRS